MYTLGGSARRRLTDPSRLTDAKGAAGASYAKLRKDMGIDKRWLPTVRGPGECIDHELKIAQVSGKLCGKL